MWCRALWGRLTWKAATKKVRARKYRLVSTKIPLISSASFSVKPAKHTQGDRPIKTWC